MDLAHAVHFAQEGDEAPVVFGQIGQHVLGRDEIGVVVREALQALDVADGAEHGAAQLARPLDDVVGDGEDLRALLVEQEVVVAEVEAGHVPMEVLRLHVEGEGIGEKAGESDGDVAAGVLPRSMGVCSGAARRAWMPCVFMAAFLMSAPGGWIDIPISWEYIRPWRH